MNELLKLRTFRWLVKRELDRGDDEEGAALLGELGEAVDMEEAELGFYADDCTPNYEDVIAAREAAQRPPVVEGKLVDQDMECRKCGVAVAVALEPGVTALPICPMCRLPQEVQETILEKLEE